MLLLRWSMKSVRSSALAVVIERRRRVADLAADVQALPVPAARSTGGGAAEEIGHVGGLRAGRHSEHHRRQQDLRIATLHRILELGAIIAC